MLGHLAVVFSVARELLGVALSTTPDWWTAVGTVATAVVAVIAAGFAGLQVKHARELREEQARPVVVVDFEPSGTGGSFVDLVVRNTGRTIAYDVKIVFSPPISSTLDRGAAALAESELLTKGIPTLPPGKEYRALFEVMHKRFNQATNKFDKDEHAAAYDVTVEFFGVNGKKYPMLKYRLSLDVYVGLRNIQRKSVHDLAKEFKDFSNAFSRIVTGNEIRVGVRDLDYHDWAEDWQMRHGGGEWPDMGNPTSAGRPSPHRYDYLDGQSTSSRQRRLGRPKLRGGRKLRELASKHRTSPQSPIQDKAAVAELTESR